MKAQKHAHLHEICQFCPSLHHNDEGPIVPAVLCLSSSLRNICQWQQLISSFRIVHVRICARSFTVVSVIDSCVSARWPYVTTLCLENRLTYLKLSNCIFGSPV